MYSTVDFIWQKLLLAHLDHYISLAIRGIIVLYTMLSMICIRSNLLSVEKFYSHEWKRVMFELSKYMIYKIESIYHLVYYNMISYTLTTTSAGLR